MADPRVAVIPVTNAALQAVTTPYVAFESPFKDRPGRLARQADALNIDAAMAAFVVGDVWPVGQARPYTERKMRRFVRDFPKFRPTCSTHVWPETALYRTAILQSCHLNERVQYRKPAEVWTCLRRALWHSADVRAICMPEPMIETEDRLLYSHKFGGPKIALPDVQCAVSVLCVLDGEIPNSSAVLSALTQSRVDLELLVADCDGQALKLHGCDDERLTILDTAGLTRAAAMNKLLKLARGERIAIWDPSCAYDPSRLRQQLVIDADFVGGPVGGDAELEAFDPIPLCHTNLSGLSYVPQETMMLSRRALDRLGGFDDCLSVHYALDMQLRAFGDPELSMAQQRTELATRSGDNVCSEHAVYGLYQLFVRRDVLMYHYAREAAHQWVGFKDIRR